MYLQSPARLSRGRDSQERVEFVTRMLRLSGDKRRLFYLAHPWQNSRDNAFRVLWLSHSELIPGPLIFSLAVDLHFFVAYKLLLYFYSAHNWLFLFRLGAVSSYFIFLSFLTNKTGSNLSASRPN